jgi:hypothetical protein
LGDELVAPFESLVEPTRGEGGRRIRPATTDEHLINVALLSDPAFADRINLLVVGMGLNLSICGHKIK